MSQDSRITKEVDPSLGSATLSHTVTPSIEPSAPIADERSYERLPVRVRDAITRAQEASEVLIGWIQLGVLLVFAALYVGSPKTFTDEADFAPVPWALAAYFAFTLVRLSFARHSRLPDWFLYVSVVVDMGLLLGLIWSSIARHQ